MSANAQQINAQQVYDVIVNGTVDDDFDTIYAALKKRRKVLADRLALSLKTGTVVRLANVRPKYLDGMQGVIIGKERSKFVVLLDSEYRFKARSYAWDGELRCKASMLEVVANAHE